MPKGQYIQSTLDHSELVNLLDYNKETGEFTWKVKSSPNRLKGSVAGYTHRGYRKVKVKQVVYFAHRLAWFYVTGTWPIETIDHIDRNPSNNRLSNLREARRVDNAANLTRQKRPNKSGFRGVYFDAHGYCLKKPWVARLSNFGKTISLGYFESPLEAAKKRDAEARKLYGEFYSGDPVLTQALRLS